MTVPVGVYVKGIVVQLDVLCAGIVVPGSIVIVTVNTAPSKQVPEVGVTAKVAVDATDRLLANVLVTVALFVPDAPPVTPAPNPGAAHAYFVPDGMTPVGVYENATPLQEDPVCEVMLATGLIVTATVNGAPVVQLPDVGVTLYVAVAATDKVLLLNRLSFRVVWPMPDAPPLRPEASMGADHA